MTQASGMTGVQSFLHIPVCDQRLAACLHLPAKAEASPSAIVICCHGLTGTRVGSAYRFVAIARRLADEGIACLRFDFRGCGESDGRFIDVTIPSLLADLQAAIEAVRARVECDAGRMGIVGSSFGAYTASLAAGSLVGLRSLAFIAPVADPKALVDRDMTPEAWDFLCRKGWVEHHGLPLGRQFIDSLLRDDVPARLAAARRPVLIFHGTGDRQVPIEQGRAYEAALRSAGVEVRLEAIDSSDHGMRSVAASAKIVDGVVQWMRRFLQQGSAPASTA